MMSGKGGGKEKTKLVRFTLILTLSRSFLPSLPPLLRLSSTFPVSLHSLNATLVRLLIPLFFAEMSRVVVHPRVPYSDKETMEAIRKKDVDKAGLAKDAEESTAAEAKKDQANGTTGEAAGAGGEDGSLTNHQRAKLRKSARQQTTITLKKGFKMPDQDPNDPAAFPEGPDAVAKPATNSAAAATDASSPSAASSSSSAASSSPSNAASAESSSEAATKVDDKDETASPAANTPSSSKAAGKGEEETKDTATASGAAHSASSAKAAGKGDEKKAADASPAQSDKAHAGNASESQDKAKKEEPKGSPESDSGRVA